MYRSAPTVGSTCVARVQCLCASTRPLRVHPALYMCQYRYDKNIKAIDPQISATNKPKEREKKKIISSQITCRKFELERTTNETKNNKVYYLIISTPVLTFL